MNLQKLPQLPNRASQRASLSVQPFPCGFKMTRGYLVDGPQSASLEIPGQAPKVPEFVPNGTSSVARAMTPLAELINNRSKDGQNPIRAVGPW
jgi:hypothetical protein